jgi:hypothetical protein
VQRCSRYGGSYDTDMEVLRCRYGEVQTCKVQTWKWKHGDMQACCRCADVQMCRHAEVWCADVVQMCRCAEVEMLRWCRGGPYVMQR